LIASAIASITLNPLLYRLVDPVATWWSGVGNGPLPADAAIPAPAAGRHQAVVVGYGPVGRTVTRLLLENEIAPTVVELNMDTVKDLKGSGIRAVYGDANHLATLEEAGARHARSVIFTVSGMAAAEESIRLVRELNPRVQILARTAYLRERAALRRAGADQVFSGEGEVALTLTESILASLGATAEQIDRERARVHGELN
jgi:CPA2 family monovalent cation:H+ antiporter-2